MKILLWVIFYLITSVFLLYFFVREKKVIGFIRKKEDDVLKKVPLQSDGKNITLGNILTLVALVVTALFFVLVDKTYDQTIAIKIWGVYGIFILNLVFYVMKKEHEWIFLGNLVMMLLGRLMFNILDSKYYVYLAINVVLSLILVYLFRKPAEEKINEKTILKEIADAKSEDEYLLDNSISMEDKIEITKVRRSSFGKAVTRISNSLLAVILVGLIQVFYIGNYVIPSGSMEPTILIKDRVFANMIKYRFTAPKIGQIIAFKEPMANTVMYTKRLVGGPGDTLQIVNKRILINDKVEEILNRPYNQEGVLNNNKIYIPKKGDKVKLDKVIAINKMSGYAADNTFVVYTRWDDFTNGTEFKNLTGKEFLQLIGTQKGYKDIIGVNDGPYKEDDPKTNTYYTFTLKVEGRNEMVMPIMDFKYDDALFTKLLNGETITLDKDYYMAMGDNTGNSFDSRYFGNVSRSRIKGELLVRWWPLNRIGLL